MKRKTKTSRKDRDTTLVRLSRGVHRLLRIEAAKRGVRMSELAEQALRSEFGRKSEAA